MKMKKCIHAIPQEVKDHRAKKRRKCLLVQNVYKETTRRKETRRIIQHNKRAKDLYLPHHLSVEEWRYALSYFNNSCAICEVSFEETSSTLDHWIPFVHAEGIICPGTIAGNVIPLCKICNSSKGTYLPTEWLRGVYDAKEAERLLNKIRKYITHISGRPYFGY